MRGAGGMKGQSWASETSVRWPGRRTAVAGMSRVQELIRKDPGATSCGPGRVMLGYSLELGQGESELA